ncbi:MAG: DUF5615 family PIN-like protein [Candidatus Binataceae bacterium]
MTARFKVDEDLPLQIADLLTERGHDATTVVAQGWQGISDDMLWPRVQNEARWLITADKGFADLRKYPPGTHSGVILLRSQEESRRAYLDLAVVAVDRLAFEDVAGAVVVITHRGVRIRRAPHS